jgi:CDP-diacylglycerol--serine O-phosphatidyltransferase
VTDDNDNMISIDKKERTSFKEMKGKSMQKGILILPSVVTAAGLFLGFFAIIYTLRSVLLGREEFELAVYSIILAGIVDSLDGRLARAMKAESEFGQQFDSIADMVSFGVAPAVLVYGMALIHLDRLGWAGSFVFLACAAIRLARFNVMSGQEESKKYFKGIPSPVAAGGLALCMYMLNGEISGLQFQYSVLAITVFLALLMVSNIRFRTFKEIDLEHYRIQTFMVIVLVLVLVFSFREIAMFWLFISYLVGGMIEALVLWRKRKKSHPNQPFTPFGD